MLERLDRLHLQRAVRLCPLTAPFTCLGDEGSLMYCLKVGVPLVAAFDPIVLL